MDSPVVKHQVPHLGEKVIPKAEEDRERSEQENFVATKARCSLAIHKKRKIINLIYFTVNDEERS